MAANDSAAGNSQSASDNRAAPFVNPHSASDNQTAPFLNPEFASESRAAPFPNPQLASSDRTLPYPGSESSDRGARPELAGAGSAGRSAGGALEVGLRRGPGGRPAHDDRYPRVLRSFSSFTKPSTNRSSGGAKVSSFMR